MKIAIIISSMDAGGAERVVASLANVWSNEGHQTSIILLSNKIFYDINPKVKLRILDLQGKKGKINKGLYLLKVIFQLQKELKTDGTQCIIGFMTFNNLFSVPLAKLAGLPLIISERCNPYLIKESVIITLLRRLMYRYADAIVLQTKGVLNSFQKARIRLPDRKVIIFNPVSDTFRNSFQKRENVILSVGRLSIEKGHDLLLEAFKSAETQDWELWIIGEGPRLTELMNLSVKLGIEGQVKFLGRMKNISDYYNTASIFVLPSKTEGFPNALCEAMACGCGVISFDCPNGPSEIIRDGKNGLLIQNGNVSALSGAITLLINKKELLTSISLEASAVVSQLNINQISKQWIQVIKEVSHSSDPITGSTVKTCITPNATMR